NELALALLELGDHVREVGDDALGVFVGVEQIVNLVLVEEGPQRAAGISGVAMAGAEAVAGDLFHRLGEEATDPREAVGAAQCDLIDIALEPAMLQEEIQ